MQSDMSQVAVANSLCLATWNMMPEQYKYTSYHIGRVGVV
jgi:hypothetical protein